MTHRIHNSRFLAAMRTGVLLLLFLPAHVAFVLLIDLDFLPDAAGSTTVGRTEDRSPGKERLRLHLLRQSEARHAAAAVRQDVIDRDLEPWSLCLQNPAELPAGESVSVKLTAPAALELWLSATPQNHRAPPA
jgi:hypothetical protein